MRASRWIAGFLAVAALGCRRPDVVVFCATDQEHAETILREFESRTGLRVRAVFDTEASKTVGLARVLLEERDHPRADVHWNNEPLQAAKLAEAGVYEPYDSPSAKSIPEAFRDPEHRFTAFSARARLLLVNTELVPEGERPSSIHALRDPKWRGKGAIARPIFGSTLTHAACLAAVLGPDAAVDFFAGCLDNDVNVGSGNAHVKDLVAAGRVAFGLTDTDDANVAIEAGKPVAIVFPDQGEGEMGTLFFPNTVALVKGAPHPEAARRLVDFLLSEEVEERLAAGRAAQIPVRDAVKRPAAMPAVGSLRRLEPDWEKAARLVDGIAERLERLFVR